jgi:hypothetical protein
MALDEPSIVDVFNAMKILPFFTDTPRELLRLISEVLTASNHKIHSMIVFTAHV